MALALSFTAQAAAQADSAASPPRPHLPDAAAWAGAAALVAGSALLDRTIEAQIPYGGGTRWQAPRRWLNRAGQPQYAVAALGMTYVGGRLAHRPKLAEAAEHVTLALLASGIANGALKFGVGRERPSFTDDPFRFHPFATKDSLQSFPSGHATVAFSLAAALSEEARSPWVTVATYGGASLVGWSRVYARRHWTSDVVAGALIGAVPSHWAVRTLHARHRPPVAVTPLPGGMMVSITR